MAQAYIISYLKNTFVCSHFTITYMISSNSDRQFSKHFHHGSGGQALAQVSQRGYRVAVLANSQILTGHECGQPAADDSA